MTTNPELQAEQAYIDRAYACLARTKLRLSHGNPGTGRVASGCLAIKIGLGNETTRDERTCPIEFGLRQARVCLSHGNTCSQLADLLGLHRAFNRRQYLALPDPIAWLDPDARDHAAFTNHTDRHFTACAQRTGCGNHVCHARLARDNDGYARHLLVRSTVCPRTASRAPPAAKHHIGCNDGGQYEHTRNDEIASLATSGDILIRQIAPVG